MVVINNATPTESTGSSTSSLVNLMLGLAFLVIIGLFLFYMVPSLARSFRMPSTNVNVPEKVDVNVNTPQQ